MPLEFDNLPLTDVSIRLFFNPPIEFGYKSAFAVREYLHDEYPDLLDSPDFEIPPSAARTPFQITPGKMVAMTFENKETGKRISLQPFVLTSQWIKGDTSARYCRFGSLVESLWKTYECLTQTMPDHRRRVPIIVNVAYSNTIESLPNEDVIKQYFSPLISVTPWTETPARVRTFSLVWDHQNGIESRIELIQRESLPLGYLFKTVAGRIIENASIDDARLALGQIHDALLAMFEAIISEHAKVQWKLRKTK